MYEVSIIIPSHRPNIISSTCKKILKLSNIDKCEVIIVTDYETCTFENEFPTFKWFNIEDFSIPAKRNYGINKSKAEIIGLMDDDCLPEENWLIEGLTYLQNNPNCIGVEGQTTIEPINKETSLLKRFKRLETPGYRTNNIFYRKSALYEVALFDERFKFQREDTDLAFSLLEKGFKIEFSEQIRVTHLFRKKEYWDLLKNYFNRRYDPLLHKKHKNKYREHIKTPITKAALFVLLLYIVTSLSFFSYPISSTIILAISSSCLLVGFFTSCKSKLGTNPKEILIEFASFLFAPFVLWGALIYGSLRFKHLLLF